MQRDPDEVGTVKEFKYESASAKLVIWKDKAARLSGLYSRRRRQGHASCLLQEITEYADAEGLRIFLDVKRYGYSDAGSMSNEALKAFYGTFKFVEVKDGQQPIMMCREPSSQDLQGV